MKVFVADSCKHGYNSPTDHHWCDNDELLMFGQFQSGNGNPSEISMCGIQSRKFTTHIVVKDMNIDKKFYLELLIESIEKAMGCKIDKNGNYEINIGFIHSFNINNIMNELLQKAEYFEDGQRVRCFGRELNILEENNNA